MSTGERPSLLGRAAAVLTVGTELVLGLGLDTNSQTVASALSAHGLDVRTLVTVADDPERLSHAIADLCSTHSVVVATGGLGPTHDDVTRQAAATALGLPLSEDADIRDRLASLGYMHADAEARRQMFDQALVLQGATIIPAETGTAPGQIVPTGDGVLALLPGPPHEMRPMLGRLLELLPAGPDFRLARLSCAGMTESDAQIVALRALAAHDGVLLTMLAGRGVVSVVLHARGLTREEFEDARDSVVAAFGPACFSTTGENLAEAVLRVSREVGATLATAESCTGGLVAAALTAIPGASASFCGGIVAYEDAAKQRLLEVQPSLLAEHGAVSERTAGAMALGACRSLGASHAVSVTGIAGPNGGTAEKPVGTVCFAVAAGESVATSRRTIRGDRHVVRSTATAHALSLLLDVLSS